jgi:hypothetical protein
MKIRGRIVYSLAVVLALAACGRVEQRRAHYDKTWPADAIRRIEMNELNGTISVEAAATNQIQMAADVRSNGIRPQKGKEYEGYFTTSVVGDTLIIGEKRTRKRRVVIGIPFFSRDAARIDYTLKVPAEVALELQTINGRIATRGMSGEMRATTVNGEIDLEATGVNEVAAKAVNGRVAARFLNDFRGARLGTVNGRVTAVLPASASFLGEFTQVNGDFEAAFPLNIHSHPGSRRVSGEVNGGRYSLKITTVNGDIKVDNGPNVPVPPVVPEVVPAPPAVPGGPVMPAKPAPRT